jgi:peptidoglycan/LPS O-acetylase OafA/YrhL
MDEYKTTRICESSGGAPARIPELDALRAFAVFAVLSHHYLLGYAPKLGWMGVDLFFVLSGYFITTILLEARGEQNYYRRFYMRRALRILPLYYLMVGGILLYSKLASSGVAYEDLVKEWGSTLWLWFYAGNIRSALQNAWPPNFSLALLWSVQVEEQFYILYPLLIALVPPKHLRKVLTGGIVAALLFRIALALAVPGHWKLQFALMPCRMDNLAMGALIADYVRTSRWPLRSNTTLLLAAAGVMFISVLVYFAGPSWQSITMGTIGFTAIGLTGMMFVAWIILNAGKPSTRFFRLRPLCAAGKISYGVYLLHGPVAYVIKSVVVRSGHLDFDKTPLSALVYTVATLGVASASYRWMEEPILRSRIRIERWLFVAPVRNKRFVIIYSKHGGSAVRDSAEFSRNNLDCLRLVFASIVVLFHVYALTNIPAFYAFDKYLSADLAVKGFFVISGLLIYRSYTRSSSLASYLEKRVRRIYPAYFTIVTLAAIALCPLSSLPVSQYFGAGFWKYLSANLLFLNFLAPSLPGVFTSNSIPAVNGALWTLKIEVAFYLFVPVMHYLCSRFGTKKVMGAIFLFSCAWKYGFAYMASIDHSHVIYTVGGAHNIYSKMEAQFPSQLVYFCAGILLLLYFDWLKFHFRSILCITAFLFLIDHWYTRGVLDVFWISGLVFVCGFWRYFGNFAKYGDFSYGVYIIHFPILQTLIAFGIAGLNPAIFLPLSLSLIGLSAFLMWHLIESRFLANSSHYRQVHPDTSG